MSNRDINILLIEDNPGDARLIREFLAEANAPGFNVECADRLLTGIRRLGEGGVDVVLLDLGLPDSQGLDTFVRTHEKAAQVPVVVLTGLNDEATGTEAVRMGAQDYLMKGTVDSRGLRRSLRHAIERKRITEALAQKAEELSRSNAELEELTFEASRLLMRSAHRIATFGERLERECSQELSDQGRGDLHQIQREAGWIREFANAMIVFSDAAGEPQIHSAVDLNVVAQVVLTRLEALIQQTGGRVEVEDLSTVEADSEHMLLLVRNLVSNGLKFHKDGEGAIVKVTGRPPEELQLEEPIGQSWVLSVQDNGVGFDERHVDEIFTVFGRLHELDEYGGTGIGLAICRKVVERHGGTITARSKPGEGATFVVSLPVSLERGRL